MLNGLATFRRVRREGAVPSFAVHVRPVRRRLCPRGGHDHPRGRRRSGTRGVTLHRDLLEAPNHLAPLATISLPKRPPLW